MARWIYQRPVDRCNPTELVVAKRLARLDDEWVIRWGFYYETDREGDFVILGPTGGVLVLEVKGGDLRKLSTIGRWEGPSGDHPLTQLLAEWRAVIDALRESAIGGDVPFVAKALCLPDLDIDPKVASYKEIDRNLIVERGDLAFFETTWHRMFADRCYTVSKRERKVFLDSLAKEISPKAIGHFISKTDRIILRQTTAEYHLLDMLRGNRQLVVEGGPGSGKTWLALEQAFRFSNDGLQVLFLCYNVALAEQLSVLVSKRKAQKGEVIVRSWETLSRELLDAADVGWDDPVTPTDREHYFNDVVPGLMRDIASDPHSEPRFDALVVDEAQDHDTCWPGSESDISNAGWWEIYWKLLREKTNGRMAIFYDPAQRRLFRQRDRFEATR
jgi:Nuclease-related domain/Uncharacterized conserved protein (DUF2075)